MVVTLVSSDYEGVPGEKHFEFGGCNLNEINDNETTSAPNYNIYIYIIMILVVNKLIYVHYSYEY